MKRMIPVLPLLLLLCACSAPQAQCEFFAMDTYMTLTAYGSGAQAALAQAQTRVEELDAMFSVTDANSEIYRYNHGDATALSEETSALVATAEALGARTGGALDVHIYPLMQAWGFTTEVQRVPTQEEIDALLAQPSDLLDLGAVAKGYTGDVLAAQLKQAGIAQALLSLGGNVHCIGTKPDGTPWRIAVEDPHKTGGYLGVLEVSDVAVVTSGGYERNFEIDGTRYHHILDPSTGYPAQSGLLSVTIVCAEGLRADALSTALFVMGLEDALAHYAQYQDFEAVLVTQQNEVYLTPGLEDCFTLLGEDYTQMEMLP